MVVDDIYERARRADYNKTEPETLSQLVSSAIKIGDEIKGDYVRLRQLTDEALKLLRREDLLKSKEFADEELLGLLSKTASASDGSFQPVGGVDGYWYVPISAALVVFRQGIRNAPEVKVGANIQKINEREHPDLGATMERLMLYAEAKILREWARDSPEDIIHFMDGPVMDPPRPVEKQYIAYRAETIKWCLNKNIFVLGCVKKLLGNFLMERLRGILRDFENERLSHFASDAYLIYHVFTKASMQGGMTLYTKPLEVSDTNPVYKQYKDEGLTVYFMYFQREPRSKPFRAEIPVKAGTNVDVEKLGYKVAATLTAWSYPGYDLPIPIVIAHDKCNIRKGCAEVLYSEIITRAASNDPFDNLVRTKLGTEVM
jgi:hypothetical protein